MKAVCKTKDLLQELQKVVKIAGTNQNLPILSTILISASNNDLVIRSTNLDIGVEIVLPSVVSEDGLVAIPADVFFKTIQTVQDESIALEDDDGGIIVKTKVNTTKIKGQSVDEFPKLPVVEGGDVVEVDTQTLFEGITAVVYSSSTTTIRPELSSVYVYSKNKELVFVATDSFRLAEKRIPIAKGSAPESILIPYKNAAEIARITHLVEGTASMRIEETQVGIHLPQTYITTRVIDGAFPNYEQIIPQEGVVTATLLKHDLQNLLKKTSIFTDSFNHITFSLNSKEKEFVARAQNSDVGETTDSIPAKIHGESLEIGFNLRYVLEVLPYIHSESIELIFAGTGKPLLIKGKSDSSYRYVVMPMNR